MYWYCIWERGVGWLVGWLLSFSLIPTLLVAVSVSTSVNIIHTHDNKPGFTRCLLKYIVTEDGSRVYHLPGYVIVPEARRD